MECPFCAEEIKDSAIYCKHCRHDLTASRIVMEENKRLLARIAELEVELGTARADVPTPGIQQLSTPKAVLEAVKFVLSVVFVLLVAHYLLVISFDVRPVYLRIVSFLVPLIAFGLLYRKVKNGIAASAVAGLLVAVLAVAGMMAVVSLVDNAPFWPQNDVERQELRDYTISILLACIAGNLLGQTFVGRRMISVSSLFQKQGSASLEATLLSQAQSLQGLVQLLAAIVAASGSLIAGLKSIGLP